MIDHNNSNKIKRKTRIIYFTYNRNEIKMVSRKLIIITLAIAIFVVNADDEGKYTKRAHVYNTKSNI